MECLPAILACSQTHETDMVHEETFLKIHLHHMNRQQLVVEMQEAWQLHIANLSLNTGRSVAKID